MSGGDIYVPAGNRDISSRRWIAAFAAFLAAAGAFYLITRRVESLARFETLILLLLYTSVAFTFFPLPTAWIMLWAAREADPLLVALAGAVGTCIANLHDYYIINYLSGLRRARRFRETAFYRRAVGWFNKAPFITLAAASFFPIPIDVVRALAVSTGYPRPLYVMSTFAGRFPRYLLLAYLGYELRLSNRMIFVVFLFSVLIGAAKGLSKLRRRNGDGTDE